MRLKKLKKKKSEQEPNQSDNQTPQPNPGDAIANFYAWEPPGDERTFRCWHIQPYPLMREEECAARAKRPELFQEAGCSRRCPRWRHYRKLVRKAIKNDSYIRRAFK